VKIRTKLQMIILLSIVAFTAIMLINQSMAEREDGLRERANTVSELNFTLFEQDQIGNEYLMYRGERSKKQWYLLQEKITALLKKMDETFQDPHERLALEAIAVLHGSLSGLFHQLVGIGEGMDVNAAKKEEFSERIVSQIFVRSHSQYVEALKLREIVHEKRKHQLVKMHLYANIAIGLMSLFIVSFAVMILRNIAYPLEGLYSATERVARGDLDFKTNIRTPDEVGRLSEAFDAMTDKLKTITVSRDELNIEIEKTRKAEEALQISEKRFRTILNQAADIILVHDLQGRFVDANQEACKNLGYRREELLQLSVSDIDPKAIADAKDALWDQLIAGQRLTFESSHQRKDGTDYPVEVTLGSILLGEEKLVVAIARNITERKKMEAQLQQAQKMEAVGTLAGGIAHDFNNLLMAIQGYTSSMLLETDPGDPRYGKLKVIEGQVEAGANLTKQLLGFARAGKYDVKPMNLNRVLEKSSSMFGRTKKELVIHRRFQEDLWAVEADATQMEQVLVNLYVNAWQAMPSGGDLYLETANLTLTEADIRAAYMEPGLYVKVSVTDTGIGMDEKTKERIFEPFFTTKELGRGTGLGLAMVYGIVKGHKGFINVYSEEGKGTAFTIYLPATEKEAILEEKPSAEIVKGEETILLVDDEPDILNSMKEIMRFLGYPLLTAGSGPEALRIYEENKDGIDLVILDMIMPGMGGGETFDRLKAINPDIKVILSSGYSINGQASEIMARGCRGFIQKPVNIADLSQKIREVLDEKT
jgi:two-component system cell cycle sensor histidine kinase/response regulator CckA